MRRFFSAWAIAGILLCASFSMAQTATTSLRGVIKDPSGAVVPGAKVALVNSAGGSSYTAMADSMGGYVFPQIPPARYTITVSSTGFGAQSKTAELLVDQPATVNFTLTVQASTVTVDVSGAAQTLNTTDATLGDSVDNSTI
jgi:hypothetical protein